MLGYGLALVGYPRRRIRAAAPPGNTPQIADPHQKIENASVMKALDDKGLGNKERVMSMSADPKSYSPDLSWKMTLRCLFFLRIDTQIVSKHLS